MNRVNQKKKKDKALIPTIEDLEPFVYERLPTETARNFSYFQTFLRMGGNRGLTATAKEHNKTYQLMAKVSKRYRWHERAEIYDKIMAHNEMEARKEYLKEMVKEQEQTATQLRRLSTSQLSRLEEFLKDNNDIELKPMELLNFIKTGIELERYITGLDAEKYTPKNVSNIVIKVVNEQNPHADIFKEIESEVEDANNK